jgi:hypothetical protein
MQAPLADFSPAADRNKAAILAVLERVLPTHGHLLEIAAGTGQHAAWFAGALPGWQWQPTDAHAGSFASVQAWAARLPNVRPPLLLDVLAPCWLLGTSAEGRRFDAIYCANMLHIAPLAACAGLMRGAAAHLAPGGMLITYGPYLESDVATSDGNLAFDASLRTQNAAWGIRQRESVEAEAAKQGMRMAERHAMPANNLLLVWRQA